MKDAIKDYYSKKKKKKKIHINPPVAPIKRDPKAQLSQFVSKAELTGLI